MHVQFPIFILALLVHAGIYLTSSRADRRSRMVAGLAVLMTTWPIWYGGMVLLEAQGNAMMLWLARAMILMPYFMPFFSFLVYYRRSKGTVWR